MGHITSNNCKTSKSNDEFCCNDLNECEIQELKNVDTANLQEGDILIANASGEFYNTPLCDVDCIAELAAKVEALENAEDSTLTAYFVSTTDVNPTDGIKTLNFEVRDQNGVVVDTYTVDVPDSTELPDNVVTYEFTTDMMGNTVAEAFDVSGNSLGVQSFGTDDQTASEVPVADAGGYFDTSNVEDVLQEIGADCADKEARITALEGAVGVSSVTQNAAGDYVVTYTNGTQETLDDINVPVINLLSNPDGTQTLVIDGQQFGPFDPGVHTDDTDTFATTTNNGDGTVTVSFADGSTATFATGPHTVDTDTFTTWSTNPDGTITLIFADGTTQVVPTGNHTVDTDTFSSAVDNGDGTVTVTYADGSTFTFATGPHTVDTNTTYSFVSNPDGSITVNGSDGSTFTSPAATVDTDTFATLAGSIITFSDGQTLTVAPDDDITAVSIVYDPALRQLTTTVEEGTTSLSDTIVIPQDTTTTTAAANSLVYGLSAGQVNKPTNVAATTADVTGADPALEVSYNSMRELFTNEAAEQSGFGRMNEDGTLGFFSHSFGPFADINTIIEGYNGAYFVKNTTAVDAATSWDGVTIPPSRYAGQRLYLKSTNALSRYDNATVTIPLSAGTYYRNTNGVWAYAGVNGTYDVWVRSGELLELVGTAGGAWELTYHNINQFYGAGWHENRDGTASMHFQAGIIAGQQGIISSVPMPITVTNPTDLNVNITDKFYFPGGNIGGAAPLLAEVFVNLPTQNTVNSIAFTTYLAGDNINESNFTGAIDVQIERGRIDYSAL